MRQTNYPLILLMILKGVNSDYPENVLSLVYIMDICIKIIICIKAKFRFVFAFFMAKKIMKYDRKEVKRTIIFINRYFNIRSNHQINVKTKNDEKFNGVQGNLYVENLQIHL